VVPDVAGRYAFADRRIVVDEADAVAILMEQLRIDAALLHAERLAQIIIAARFAFHIDHCVAVDFQKVGQPARMVAVRVRNDAGVHLAEIDAEQCCVVNEGIGRARIEQNPAPAALKIQAQAVVGQKPRAFAAASLYQCVKFHVGCSLSCMAILHSGENPVPLKYNA
jgi:hypothetical protein